MDVTPLVPTDRQLIQSYGNGGFRISGTIHAGSVLVFPSRTVAWPVSLASEIDGSSLVDIATERPQILLIGTGATFALLPSALKRAMRELGSVIEAMDTGAACRTYNVLLTEGRSVAAALLAVD
jgi:uncharacterized protein